MKVKSKLIDAQLEDRASSPTKGGEILVNTAASNQVQYHDSSSVRTVANTDQAQTLTNKTLTSPVLNTSVSGSAVLDEDNMVSDSATQLATQQSIKAYADGVASTASTNLTTHINDTTTHGVAGNIVGTSDAQALTNKTINGDLNTISNLAHGAEVDNPTSGVHGVTGSVVGTSDAQTLTNKTFGDSAILTEIATPTTPSAGAVKVYAKSDGSLYKVASDGVEREVGAGGGGEGSKNYFDPDSAKLESGTVGSWLTDDGAGVASAGLTLSVTTTVGEVLEGTTSLKLVKDAADRDGHFIKLASQTIDPIDRGKQLFGSFAFKPISGYVSGDLILEVYDVTNDELLYAGQEEDRELLNVTDPITFNYNAYLESTTAQIQFRLKVNNTNTNGFTMTFDEFGIGPAAVLPATFERYEVINLAGSGDFTGGTIGVGRTGNQVTISILTAATYASAVSASSAAGLIPVWARPAGDTPYNLVYTTSSLIYLLRSNADGTFRVDSRNSGFTLTATTSTGAGSISYTVPSTPHTMTTNELGQQTASVTAGRFSAQSIPNNTITKIIWDSLFSNKGGALELNTSTGDITVKKSGWYFVNPTVRFEILNNAGTAYILYVYKNSSEIAVADGLVPTLTSGNFNPSVSLPHFDYFEKDSVISVRVFHNHGAARSITAAPRTTLQVISFPDLTLIGAVRDGGGGGGAWGTITGTLSDQTDLQTALDVASSSPYLQNPFDTSWKLYTEEFAANSYETPYGPLSLFGGKTGTGSSIVRQNLSGATGYNRVGVYRIIGGSSSGAYAYMANALGAYAAGSADIRLGYNIKLITLPDATDDYQTFFGLNNSFFESGTDMIGLMVDRTISATNWVAITKAIGTATTTDTGIALTTDWVVLETVINSDGTSVAFYIDGVLGATHTTNIPVSRAMTFNLRTSHVAGAARDFYIDVAYYAFKPATARGVGHTWIT